MLPRIDRYEITEEIGHGGMATVYRARDSRLDRWVAVKVMHPHLRGTEQARARFSREARAVAKLRHPAILEIYDYSGNQSPDAFIATELLTGPTLRVFVDQVGDIPAEIAACIGLELSSALEAAHAQGIVHRDVKPENVLLHEKRTLKLTDFGIADMLDPSMSHMTATGQILGSPAHMAPEQVEGGDVDARSDVFALGTILYWLSTGTLPFTGKNPHQVLKRVVDCNPVDPLLVRPSIGQALRDVIMRCLAKDPAARYARAQDLAAALIEVLRAAGIDEPRVALEAYLRAPSEQAPILRARVVEHLLGLAKTAVATRDRATALMHLDRVLALEDGRPEALALLADLDRATRRRVAQRAGFAAIAVSLLAGLWIAFAPRSEAVLAASRSENERNPIASTPEKITGQDTPEKAPEPPVELAPAPTPKPPHAGTEARNEPRKQRPSPAAKTPRETGPRMVVFDPDPANVTITVDNLPPRPFGPSFHNIELPPGKHVFRFVGAHECCEERVVSIDLPPGPGETVVDPKLPFRPARVYVASDVPADVVLDNGLASGRTRSFIQVPIEQRLIEARRISVTAPGYESYTGTVQLRAGEVAQVQVVLKPSAPR